MTNKYQPNQPILIHPFIVNVTGDQNKIPPYFSKSLGKSIDLVCGQAYKLPPVK